MSNNVATVSGGNFPVIDITHKPKRTQSGNILAAEKISVQNEVPGDTTSSSDFPKTVTLERAIEYYESHAKGDNFQLYSMTAFWLKKLLTKNIPVNVSTINGEG